MQFTGESRYAAADVLMTLQVKGGFDDKEAWGLRLTALAVLLGLNDEGLNALNRTSDQLSNVAELFGMAITELVTTWWNEDQMVKISLISLRSAMHSMAIAMLSKMPSIGN